MVLVRESIDWQRGEALFLSIYDECVGQREGEMDVHAMLVLFVMRVEVFFVVGLTAKTLVRMKDLFRVHVVMNVLNGFVTEGMFLVWHLGCLNLPHK